MAQSRIALVKERPVVRVTRGGGGRRERNATSPARRADVEGVLRELAFVLHATRVVRREMTGNVSG